MCGKSLVTAPNPPWMAEGEMGLDGSSYPVYKAIDDIYKHFTPCLDQFLHDPPYHIK